MSNISSSWVLVAALAAAFASGCASPPAGHGPGHGGHGAMMGGKMAKAMLMPTQGHTARGMVMFHQMDGHLMVHAKLTGLTPNTEHGFHVHETGNCASTDGSSAGGHFNPGQTPHGRPGETHHAGDLPALRADANGAVDQKFMVTGPSLTAGEHSVIGRAVVVHAQADDYTTQPAGNSGARIGCGVITAP